MVDDVDDGGYDDGNVVVVMMLMHWMTPSLVTKTVSGRREVWRGRFLQVRGLPVLFFRGVYLYFDFDNRHLVSVSVKLDQIICKHSLPGYSYMQGGQWVDNNDSILSTIALWVYQ